MLFGVCSANYMNWNHRLEVRPASCSTLTCIAMVNESYSYSFACMSFLSVYLFIYSGVFKYFPEQHSERGEDSL